MWLQAGGKEKSPDLNNSDLHLVSLFIHIRSELNLLKTSVRQSKAQYVHRVTPELRNLALEARNHRGAALVDHR